MSQVLVPSRMLAPTARRPIALTTWRLYGRFMAGKPIITDERSGMEHRGSGEIHFSGVLEGRAIPDDPRRSERRPGIRPCRSPETGMARPPRVRSQHRRLAHPLDRSGDTSLHAADRATPGHDIVQKAPLPDGTILGWSFTRIRPNSFHWLGEHRPMQAPRAGFRSRCLRGVSCRRDGNGFCEGQTCAFMSSRN